MKKFNKYLLTVIIPAIEDDISLRSTLANLINIDEVKVIIVCIDIDEFSEYKNYQNIEVISETMTGIYSAFNDGLKKTNSDFVMFCGSGDIILKEIVLSNIALHKYADVIMGRVISDSSVRVARSTKKKYINLDRMISSHSVGMVFKVKTHKSIGLYSAKFKNCADYDIYLRFLNSEAKIICVKDVFGYWPSSGYSSKIAGLDKALEHFEIKRVNHYVRKFDMYIALAINLYQFMFLQKLKALAKRLIYR